MVAVSNLGLEPSRAAAFGSRAPLPTRSCRHPLVNRTTLRWAANVVERCLKCGKERKNWTGQGWR